MTPSRHVLITGLGIVCPWGIGKEALWSQWQAGRGGIRRITQFDPTGLPVEYGGEVPDFEPKEHVRPRKSLKVMSREIQFAFTAADLAMRDARLRVGTFPPERLGVVFGADMIYCDAWELIEPIQACMPTGKFEFNRWATEGLPRIMPLWLLKYLPNMPASHVAIANDARGPCNSIILNDVSGLTALAEGVRLIERNLVDLVIVGGVGARLHPTTITFRVEQYLARGTDDPATVCRPFGLQRAGQALGEGAGALILESAEHAAARQATSYGRVAGYALRHEPRRAGQPPRGIAVAAALRACLEAARIDPAELSHVNCQGLGTEPHDQAEADVLARTVGRVPVCALKGAWGNIGAGSGPLELAASLLAQQTGVLPPNINTRPRDPACPVWSDAAEPIPLERRAFVKYNFSMTGQAAAVCVQTEG
ncbi:MAG: beta-ketoacyl-[acyl-carrier-protein] synthase family protein [Pirellulales bacterium]|nr:beta-ketoacyl-[acyl-carrier-protein] synthase family protein [Pirellulales bacterium]